MPFNWESESERALLIFAITIVDVKPTTETWKVVAEKLGGGLNGNACRCAIVTSPVVLHIHTFYEALHQFLLSTFH